MSQELVSPTGQILTSKPPGLIVIKHPRNVSFQPAFVKNLAQMTNSRVVLIPLTCDLMEGNVAQREMHSLHLACHAILDTPIIEFSDKDLAVIKKSIDFVVDATGAAEDSQERDLLSRLTTYLKDRGTPDA